MKSTKVKRKPKVEWSAGCERSYRSLCLVPFAFFLLCSCADTNRHATTRPASIRDRQDQALRDPFDYGPHDKMTDVPSVSGSNSGDSGKQGLKRDLDRVFNP